MHLKKEEKAHGQTKNINQKAKVGNLNLGQGEEQTPDGCDDNAAYQEERNVLRPKSDIDVDTEPVDGDLHAPGHWVLLADSIKYYVHCRLYKNNRIQFLSGLEMNICQ